MDWWGGGAPLGRRPGTSDGSWRGPARPDDAHYLESPLFAPRLQRTTRLAMVLVLLAAVGYAIFLVDGAARGDAVLYGCLVTAELLLLTNVAAMWITALSDEGDSWENAAVRQTRVDLVEGSYAPSIDVLVTAFGEPLEVLARTILAARDLRLPHQTYVCDDGRSDAVRDLCAELAVGYLRRADRDGVKAGNVNRALARTSGDFVALFDADHAPHPDFLLLTVPHMARRELAFVQLPQAYLLDGAGFVERASAESQQLFYEVICPGKNRYDAAFHVGTNALFRRRALEEVGGFFEDTHSEDIWTSIRLHQRGWSSLYLPHVIARGLSPATVYAYFRQQFRWASGSFEILLRSNPLVINGLTAGQRLAYSAPPLNYLTAFANGFYLLLPPLFLLFGIAPLNTDAPHWLAAYLPFLLLTHVVLALQSGGFRWRPILLSVVTVPVHLQAFFAVLVRRRPEWLSTNSSVAVPSAVEVMLPQLVMVAFNIAAIAVGLSAVGDPVATFVSVGLCAVHSLAMLAVAGVAGLDRIRARRAARPGRRGGRRPHRTEFVLESSAA